MNTLPAELLVNILRFIPGDDLTRFTRVSKRFPEILEKNKKLIPNQRPIVSIRIYTETPGLVYPEKVFLRIFHKGKYCELVLKKKNKTCEWLAETSDHYSTDRRSV